MTEDKGNLESLVQENKRLLAEVERLRQELANWKPLDEPFAGNQAEFAFRRFQGTARTLRVKWNPTPLPVPEAPQPRFKVGDRVIVSETGFPYEISSVWFRDNEYIYFLFYGGSAEGCFSRHESQLKPYNENRS